MIELYVNRESETDDATLGRFLWEENVLYYTLEPLQRAVKIWGKTAIPCGRYQILMQYSPKFSKEMPHLQNVPDFTDIMVHPLNFVKDTEGCIGIGLAKGNDDILQSQAAFADFMPRLETALLTSEVWITIASDFPITH